MSRSSVLIAILFITALCFLAESDQTEGLPSVYVVASTFSLKNPGELVIFTLSDPNTYLKKVSFPGIDGSQGLAVNNKAREFYIGMVSGETWFNVYDSATLKLKRQVAESQSYVAQDFNYDETLGQMIVIGGNDSSPFGVYTVDLSSPNSKWTLKLSLPNIADLEESAFAYDFINHRYFLGAGMQNGGCQWVIVDTKKFKLLPSIDYACTGKSPYGDRSLDNAQYSPATNQLIGILANAEAFTVDLKSGTYTDLFNMSASGGFRNMGQSISLMVPGSSASTNTYLTQISSSAPVQTNLVAVSLSQGAKPVWKAFPRNPFGDLLNGMGIVNLTASTKSVIN